MPFIPVANTVLCEIRMTIEGQHVENTLYFEFPTAPVLADLITLGGVVSDWWAVNIAPLVASSLELREVALTDLTSSSGPVSGTVPTTPLVGGLASGAMPNNVSLTVSFRTGLRGRSFRGRNYVIGLTEAQVAGSVVEPTTITALQSAYTQLITDIEDAGWTWVVVSRFSGVDGDGEAIPRVAGITTPVVSVLIVDAVVDSQRRRLPGRGT